jgi:hypothetical protein
MFVIVVLAGRELLWEERVLSPLPLVVVPPVKSERWSCLDCRLQVRVLLHTDLSKGCGCVSRRTQQVVSTTAHPYSTLCICIDFDRNTLALKSTHLVCSLLKNLEPADLNDDFYAIRITCVADEKPTRDALDDDAANTGCSSLVSVSYPWRWIRNR